MAVTFLDQQRQLHIYACLPLHSPLTARELQNLDAQGQL